MLTYTVYSEAGGVAKTTTAANLAVAHARSGLDVLVVDMDPQNASLSYLFGVDDDRGDANADSLVRHMVGRPNGPFQDLVREAEHGVDVVPTHNLQERLTQLLIRMASNEEELHGDQDYEFPKHAQLLEVLQKAGVPDAYDVLIVDPPANGEDHQNNALYATRNVVIPIELSGKGEQSIRGLEEIVDGMEDDLEVTIGVLALVPFKFEGTNDQQEYLERLEALPYDVPVVIGKRTSLFEGCWREQCSAFTYLGEYRAAREYERETLEQLDALADHLVAQSDIRGQGATEAVDA